MKRDSVEDGPPAGGRKQEPTQRDYELLGEFRYLIRRFLEFSQDAARNIGLTPQHHQALLAIRGFPEGQQHVTVGDLAERLRIRHHSAGELAKRLDRAGLVTREQDMEDQRRVLLRLTPHAEALLAELSAAHLDELSRIEPMLRRLLARDGS